MGGSSNVQVDVRPSGIKTVVHMAGVVDELADFSALASLNGVVEINLRGLKRFNSAGVRVWVDALRELTSNAKVSYVECATTVIDQLNMITGFLGAGYVESFYAAMLCPGCDSEENHLFRAREVRDLDRLPEVRCSQCSILMELDDIEDQYLLFLREPTFVGG